MTIDKQLDKLNKALVLVWECDNEDFWFEYSVAHDALGLYEGKDWNVEADSYNRNELVKIFDSFEEAWEAIGER